MKNSLEIIELLGLLIPKQWAHFHVPQMALLEFYVAAGFQTPVRRVASTWYLSKDTLPTDVMCQLSHLGPAWVKIRLSISIAICKQGYISHNGAVLLKNSL